MGLQVHYDHFPQSTAYSITGAIPERGILSAASDLISMIHKPLKNSALLNIQEGVWQSEGREISRQKELGKRNKSYWNLQNRKKILQNKDLTGFYFFKNESTISITDMLTIIAIRL